MTYSPYSKGKIAHSSSQSKKQGFSITSQKVMDLALNTAKEHIPITRLESAFYEPDDVLSMTLYAAAHQTTIEQACLTLQQAPHPNTVRLAVKGPGVDQVESQLNACVATSFPKGLLKRPAEVAIDLKLVECSGNFPRNYLDVIYLLQPAPGRS